jgi:PAS domain S-box-containing protein
LTIRHMSGKTTNVLYNATIYRNERGETQGVFAAARDITERKKVEQALRESEARLRALFDYSLVGILLTAPDGRVFAANPAACSMLGRTEDQIIKIGRPGLVDRNDPRLVKLLEERQKNGYAADELNLIRADGTVFPSQVSSAVYETEVGPRTCMVIQDISERKRAEKRIHEFSRKLLSVREEEKRILSSVLHHDVGSITVGVMARLHAAEEDLRAGKNKAAMASLREGLRLFVKSVKQLKALAIELRPPDLDILGLPAALTQYIDQITHKIPLKIHIADTTRGAKIPPEIQTVCFRIVQECLNNIVKHAQARQVRVRISSSRQQLRLSITDDGKGFDQALQALEPGTHLGLQAMQEMVAGLGGILNISSSPGKGVRVIVTIPHNPGSFKTVEPQ